MVIPRMNTMRKYQELAIILSLGLSLIGCGGVSTEDPTSLPVAKDDTATVSATQKKLTVIPVLDNDKPKGELDVSSVEVITPPEYGTVNIRSTGEIEYNPTSSPLKADSFVYTVKDNKGNFSNPATVAITVTQLPFKITVKTDNAGASNNNEFTIPIVGGNYDVNCGDVGTTDGTDISGSYTCSYPTAGTYNIAITGDIPHISFLTVGGDVKDNLKLQSIDQWGTGQWGSMENAFDNCIYMTLTATDVPDFSKLTSLRAMFAGASSFNGDIGNWNVSSVTDMSFMFVRAGSFNQDISRWDVRSVGNMRAMFSSANSFNQDLGSWDVGKVTNMTNMFTGAKSFTTTNYDKLMIGWSALADNTGVQNSVVLKVLTPKLSCYPGLPGPSLPPLVAKNNLINNYGWQIKDGGCLFLP